MSPWLIVGLGNPGIDYEMTRHNVGYLVVDELACRARASFTRLGSSQAQVVSTTITSAGIGIPGGEKVIVAKPGTYMNNSGQAVASLASFYKIPADRIVVIHDELDLDLGRLRLKIGGGDNGHNGLRSIRAHLKTGDFYRIRFGIGRPPGTMGVSDYVLRRFSRSERDDLTSVISLAADAAEILTTV